MNSRQIENICRPIVESEGYDLILAEWTGSQGRSILRLYIDHEDGVGVDDCAQVSRRLSRELDVEDPIPGTYSLEVSTPGLDRPLARERDFVRFAGLKAAVRLSKPTADGHKRITGTVTGANNGAVSMLVDGEPVTFALADVVKANLVYEG